MNTKLKRRMIISSIIIVLVIVALVMVIGGNTAAKTISVAEASEGSYAGQKVQVSGNVAAGSYETTDNELTFQIYDPDNPADLLNVTYGGVASSTFGNDVTAICTGRIDDSGTLECTELITKCPSKYESSTEALTVARLLGYGPSIQGTIVKVAGIVAPDTLGPIGQEPRFVLEDPETAEQLPVIFDGPLPDELQEGSAVIVTGSVDADQSFAASGISLQEQA